MPTLGNSRVPTLELQCFFFFMPFWTQNCFLIDIYKRMLYEFSTLLISGSLEIRIILISRELILIFY